MTVTILIAVLITLASHYVGNSFAERMVRKEGFPKKEEIYGATGPHFSVVPVVHAVLPVRSYVKGVDRETPGLALA